jgi:hypothetical protein
MGRKKKSWIGQYLWDGGSTVLEAGCLQLAALHALIAHRSMSLHDLLAYIAGNSGT